MNKVYKRIFLCALMFYLLVTMYTRFKESDFNGFSNKLIYSLPLDFMDQKGHIKFQPCVLSAPEVVELLKTNPHDCPFDLENRVLPQGQKYLALRCLDTSGYHYGDLKVYFSCFKHPLVMHYRSGPIKVYDNIIIPMPYHTSQQPCDVSMHWKNFWGGK